MEEESGNGEKGGIKKDGEEEERSKSSASIENFSTVRTREEGRKKGGFGD